MSRPVYHTSDISQATWWRTTLDTKLKEMILTRGEDQSTAKERNKWSRTEKSTGSAVRRCSFCSSHIPPLCDEPKEILRSRLTERLSLHCFVTHLCIASSINGVTIILTSPAKRTNTVPSLRDFFFPFLSVLFGEHSELELSEVLSC